MIYILIKEKQQQKKQIITTFIYLQIQNIRCGLVSYLNKENKNTH